MPIWAQKTYSVFALHFFDKRKEGKGSMSCQSLLYMINIKALPVFCILKKLSCQLLFSLKFKHGNGMMLTVFCLWLLYTCCSGMLWVLFCRRQWCTSFCALVVTNIFHFVLKGNKYNFGILIAHFVIFCFSKTYMKTMKDVGSFKVKFKGKERVGYKRIYAK